MRAGFFSAEAGERTALRSSSTEGPGRGSGAFTPRLALGHMRAGFSSAEAGARTAAARRVPPRRLNLYRWGQYETPRSDSPSSPEAVSGAKNKKEVTNK